MTRKTSLFPISRASSAAFLSLVCALWTSDSFAYQFLYDSLVADYGYSGDCSVCHATPVGGGIAGKPFALKLKEKGLVGADVASLKTAMDALTPADDSDGDGASDFDEVTQAGDPNDPAIGIGAGGGEEVEYGCVGGTIAGRTKADPSTALAAAGFVAAALLWSRRRRSL